MTPQEALRERSVIVGIMGEFDFPDTMVRAWTGKVPFATNDGRVWQPVGDFGVVKAPETTDGIESDQMMFSLRRRAEDNRLDYDAFVAAANEDRQADILGRDLTIYFQTFRVHTDGNGTQGTAIGLPVPKIFGRMSHARTVREGVTGYSLEVYAENLVVDGHLPSYGYFTAEDQRARFAGDKGLDLISRIAQIRRILWPRD